MSTTRKNQLKKVMQLAWQFVKKKRLHSLGSLEGSLGKCKAPHCNADTNCQVLLSKGGRNDKRSIRYA